MPDGFHLPEQVATLATVDEVEREGRDGAVGEVDVRLEGAQRVDLGLPVGLPVRDAQLHNFVH